jgi:hypothetical protein
MPTTVSPRRKVVLETVPAVPEPELKAPPVSKKEEPEVKAPAPEAKIEVSLDDGKKKDDRDRPPFLAILLAFVFGVVVGGGVFGGIFYYKFNIDRLNLSAGSGAEMVVSDLIPTPAVTPTPSVAPKASPSAQLKLSDYKMEVLNGSGVAGRASSVKQLLETAGFNGVKTGDADNYNYEDTEVSLKSSVPAGVFDAVSKALGTSYKVVKADKLVPETSTYDVIVTVGTKKT